MRYFFLYNAGESSYYDLNTNIVTTDISGLGSKMNVLKLGKKPYDFEEAYDDISLKLVFGVGANAYTQYKALMEFIGANGKNRFVLKYMYQTATTIETRYVDVWLKDAPKSQKNSFSVIEEIFTFERESPWYEKVTASFNSGALPYNLTIINAHTKEIELDIYLSASAVLTGQVFNLKLGTTVVKHIQILTTTTYSIYISASTKRVYLTTTNLYDKINKAYQTFLTVPTGTYVFNVTAIAGGTGSGTVSYKKWVVD